MKPSAWQWGSQSASTLTSRVSLIWHVTRDTSRRTSAGVTFEICLHCNYTLYILLCIQCILYTVQCKCTHTCTSYLFVFLSSLYVQYTLQYTEYSVHWDLTLNLNWFPSGIKYNCKKGNPPCTIQWAKFSKIIL